MKTILVSYGSALVSMLVIDAIWLTIMLKRFYVPAIGSLMASSPNIVAAGIFYLIYIAGVCALVVVPAVGNQTPLVKVFILGAILGLVAYATYDLTNQATLKEWSTIVTAVDLVWGTLLTGTVAVIATYCARLFS
ncbi:MAG: hypothetical protein RIQ54_610 [Candidatus Parcubacteria bacterium]|jgi:uncharacterized membrane protein